MIEKYFPYASQLPDEFVQATLETVYMVVISALIAGVLGLFLGIVLILTGKDGLKENKHVYNFLDKLVDIGRSIPFIILLAVIFPFTRFVVGTIVGTTAAIPPLVVATVPFYARQIQNALLEVDPGVIEAARAMGVSDLGIVFRVYLKEGLVPIIRASNFTMISLIGLTTMAGAVGGGGLGQLAISKGYQRYHNDVTFAALIILLILVFITQLIGNIAIKLTSKNKKR
ncbi:methionine ABC transporter permease [Floricoccus penangensis]|uniref:Methionine ABC transporter permease n=1 Tax=Floricoccus penangensis TaxID=1859475 RepID=A0A9Q5JHG6_9LACT|nr:methionine ABC transporter permease [Floricoccus penangensis]OFI47077.1 methionine ABC transporter permease [Floricoccus penangensis]URZ87736.1 ABC transporter permease [Floricoccus penangensis]